MNVTRLRQLRARINKAEYRPAEFTGEGIEFNMSAYWRHTWNEEAGHHCKTPACLAGHAIAMWADPNDTPDNGILYEQNMACELLGLTRDQGCKLFGPGTVNWQYVTPKMAAKAITRLIKNPDAEEKELWS